MSNRKYTCHNSDSEDHFIRNCPPLLNQTKRGTNSTRFTGLVQREDSSEDNSFDIFFMSGKMKKTENKLSIMVDTGATKTVIGDVTLAEILKVFSNEQRIKMTQIQDQGTVAAAKFKFRDGKTVAAQKIVHIPIQIFGRVVKMKTFVMPGKIPFC